MLDSHWQDIDSWGGKCVCGRRKPKRKRKEIDNGCRRGHRDRAGARFSSSYSLPQARGGATWRVVDSHAGSSHGLAAPIGGHDRGSSSCRGDTCRGLGGEHLGSDLLNHLLLGRWGSGSTAACGLGSRRLRVSTQTCTDRVDATRAVVHANRGGFLPEVHGVVVEGVLEKRGTGKFVSLCVCG